MEYTDEIIMMLNQITSPAFIVSNGIIQLANPAAEGQMIETGTAIENILATGQQEYSAFGSGNLFLSLQICGNLYHASVSRTESYDLFVLEQEADLAELQSMALAAQELRSPLSSVMSIADSLFPLIGDPEDSAAQKKIAQINRGLFQMLRIVSNMSDAYRYSKEQSSRLETRDVVQDFSTSLCIKSQLLFQFIKRSHLHFRTHESHKLHF